ncbi:MAG TPA: hypothetical protein VIG29_10620 [Vicinamibacteria bacterium]
MLEISLWNARAAAARSPFARRDRPSLAAGLVGGGAGFAAPEGRGGAGSRGIVVDAGAGGLAVLPLGGAADVVAEAGAVVVAGETGGAGELVGGIVVAADTPPDVEALAVADVVVVSALVLGAGFEPPATSGHR